MSVGADEGLVEVKVSVNIVTDASWWAEGATVRLPAGLARLLDAGPAAALERREVARTAARHLRCRAAFLKRPPASGWLPIDYRSVPAPMRRAIASVIGRYQRRREASWASFPGWPIDLSADFCADLVLDEPRQIGPIPVLLTHDIDSPEGLRNCVSMFLPLEEAVGARSANYVVPCAWPLDQGLLDEVLGRGHEVGIHGYDHSFPTAFSSPGERLRRIAAGLDVARGVDAVGYRAPSLVRNADLLRDLAPHYLYDSSIPTSGGPFPAANNGCASARPWRAEGIWEVPLSMPRDGTLRFLGFSAEEILALWIKVAGVIASSGGIVCLLTHCERGFSGNPPMLAAYQRFLAFLADDPRFVFTRPVDLVRGLGDEV